MEHSYKHLNILKMTLVDDEVNDKRPIKLYNYNYIMYNYTSYEDDYNYPAVEYRYTCKYMYVYSI